MNVVFTCGGTGGHINPAIAIANIWRERHPDSNILFICGDDPLEKKLVPQAGYKMVSLHTLGFMRVKAWWAVKYNLHAINHARKSVAECKKLFREPWNIHLPWCSETFFQKFCRCDTGG